MFHPLFNIFSEEMFEVKLLFFFLQDMKMEVETDTKPETRFWSESTRILRYAEL